MAINKAAFACAAWCKDTAPEIDGSKCPEDGGTAGIIKVVVVVVAAAAELVAPAQPSSKANCIQA